MATFHLKLDTRSDQDAKQILIRPYHNGKRYSFVPTGIYTTESIWNAYKDNTLTLRSKEARQFTQDIAESIDRAESIANRIPRFDYSTWKRLFSSSGDTSLDVSTAFDLKTETVRNQRTKQLYHTTKKKINKYPDLPLMKDITPEMLQDIEEWMEHEEELAWSSIGIYMRNFRAVFNYHIKKTGLITNYPFHDYTPPTGENIKKALYPDEVHLLLDYQDEDYYNQRAADFWKICFLTFGRYPSDLMNLTWDQFKPASRAAQEEGIQKVIVFTHRTKTSRSRTRREFEVPVTPTLQKLLEKWSNGTGDHVFNFGNYSAWNRRVNQRLKKIGRHLGIRQKLTLQTARHTAATKILHAGADISFIQAFMGHSDQKTTENYLDSFANDFNREFAKKLLE